MSLVYKLNNRNDIKELLKRALEEKYFDGVLGLFSEEGIATPQLGMTSNIKDIDRLSIFAPIMPVQASRVISNIKFTENKLKIACVIKPCEMRAVVELVKLKQIVPDNLFFISMDCAGALEVLDYRNSVNAGKNPSDSMVKSLENFEDFSKDRYACSICDKFIPRLSDIRIRSLGKEIYIEPLTEKGKSFMEALTIEVKEENLSDYDEKVKQIYSKRVSERNGEREKFAKEINNVNAFLKELDGCIRCHNCMVNCPMDYCKECIFRSPVFDHPSENYNIWLERKGTVKLPTDTLIFHMTRLNHMSTSCVSCGMCESSCPSKIKLTRIFAFIGEETQKIFDYEPGRSFEEELPVATFREKELDKI